MISNDLGVNRIHQYIQISGIVLLFVTTGLGGFFIMKGVWLYASIITVVGIVLMYLLVIQLWKLKSKERNRGFDFREFFWLLLYVVIALISYAGIFHGYNLQFHAKEEIINLGENIGMEINEELPRAFEDQAKKSILSYELELRNQGKSDATVKNYVDEVNNTLTDVLMKNQNDSIYVTSRVNIIKSWGVVGLHQALYDLDKRLSRHIEVLEDGFKIPAKNNAVAWDDSFEYEREYVAGDIISSPFQLISTYSVNYTIPLVIWLFCHAMILIPYCMQERGAVSKYLR